MKISNRDYADVWLFYTKRGVLYFWFYVPRKWTLSFNFHRDNNTFSLSLPSLDINYYKV